jgi:transcriptional regulator with GAF, ATPase, and Fis domain
MISSHQKSFDFNSGNPNVISIKRSKPLDLTVTSVLEDLNAKLIGNSPEMEKLKRSIQTVASSVETVLITGESGTGKELIARAIHDVGSRRDKVFLAVNCGALTESLLESELFGHVKGAFTGATTNKKGFFEAANGGTIFLDEFAEMSLAVQQRFLRVLQEGTVRPVGNTESREIAVDARVIVATNHDLKSDVACGRFRNDLYYRVNVLRIESPALRDRREDILALTQHFIGKYNDRNSVRVSEAISPQVLGVLEAYKWPGNVRELENIIKRVCINASAVGVITAEDFRLFSEFRDIFREEPQPSIIPIVSPLRKLNHVSGTKEPQSCRCTERLNQYQEVLDGTGGNLSAAARRLKIPRTTLRKRLIALHKRCQ